MVPRWNNIVGVDTHYYFLEAYKTQFLTINWEGTKMEHYSMSQLTQRVQASEQWTKKLPRWNITYQSEQLTRTFAVLVGDKGAINLRYKMYSSFVDDSSA